MNKLAFVLLRSTDAAGKEPVYWLQWNPHVDSPNFLGGKLDANESFQDAARRELSEELGAFELNKRYAPRPKLRDSAAFKAQVKSLLSTIKPLHAAPVRLAMYSLRATREPAKYGPADTVREVQFFGAELCSAHHPLVIARLRQLQSVAIPNNADAIAPPQVLIHAFDAAELAQASRAWEHNPFVDYAFAAGLIVYSQLAQGFRPWDADPLALACTLQRTLQGLPGEPGVTNEGVAHPFAEVAVRVIEAGHERDDEASRSVRVELRHPDRPGKKDLILLRLPWPQHGVFRLATVDGAQDACFCWVSRLIRRLGARPKNSTGTDIFRLSAGARHLAVRWKILVGREAYPNLSPKAARDLGIAQTGIEEELAKAVARALDPALSPATDYSNSLHRDDLDLYFVQTFVAYCLHLIVTRAVLTERANKGSADKAWERLQASLESLPTGFRTLRKLGLIEPMDPLNAVDVAARLSEIRRHAFPADVRARLPANYRQLHRSQRGLVCPFQTPESNQIGLTLHLTSRARINVNGTFVLQSGAAPGHWSYQELLGVSAQLIPFSAHNDAARNTLGAKNLRQAVPVVAAEPPRLATMVDPDLLAALAPACSSFQFQGDATLTGGTMLPGVNLLVAFMPWFGLNSDDAIVVSESASKLLAWQRGWSRRYRLRPGLRASMCVAPGDPVSARQVLANLIDSAGAQEPDQSRREMSLRAQEAGVITRACWIESPAPWLGGVLEISIDIQRPLMPGDKLMGRHGNKGVVAAILPDHLMPRLPESDAVPVALRGKPLQVLLNPLGVIARMNLGQIMETQLTWAHALHANASPEVLNAAPRATPAQTEILQDQDGVVLSLPSADGELAATAKPIAVGWQFILRLKHSPADKGVYRGTPADAHDYDPITGQPVRGRFRSGGQCLGEMELWALAAHQAVPVFEQVFRRGHLPAANTPALWEVLQDQLWAAGGMVEHSGDKLTIRPVAHADVQHLSRYQPVLHGNSIAAAQMWRCPQCSELASLSVSGHDNIPVAVFVTENDKQRSNLVGFLDALGATLPQQGALRSLILGTQPGVVVHKALKLGLTEFKVAFEFTGSAHKLTLVHKSSTYEFYASSKKPIDPFTRLFWHCPVHKTGSGWLVPVAPQPFDGGALSEQSRARQVIWFNNDLFCPVIPARYRASHLNADGRWEHSPLEIIYGRAAAAARGDVRPDIEAFKRWREAATQAVWRALTGKFSHPGWLRSQDQGQGEDDDTESQAKRARAMYDSVTRLLGRAPFGLQATSGKQGLLRRVGLRRRVNESGRFVITPNPTLRIHQAGVPMAAAAVMWKDDIAQWLDGESIANASSEPTRTQLGGPESAHWWRQDLQFFWFPPTPEVSSQSAVNLDAVWHVLERFVAAHPQRRVLLNRQPSLHRYSMMAFRPQVLDWRLGWVMQIHPLVCKGFNADFDGDEMVVHALTPVESEFAQCMEPLHQSQRLSLATDKPVMANDQDMRLGAFIAKQEDQFLAILGSDRSADEVERELHAWYAKQAENATRDGCSLRMSELLAAARAAAADQSFKVSKRANQIKPSQWGKQAMALHAELNAIAATALSAASGGDAGSSLGDLINSGARAAADKHPRQLWVSRGYLAPGQLDDANELGKGRFWCRSNLVDGLAEDDFYDSAYNGRSTLADKKLLTPSAGYITRQLVFACWGWEVHTDQCEAVRPGVLSCVASSTRPRSLCRRCLGKLGANQYPGGLPDGFPIGLLAAEFFGERGTQLSMQSYKGAGRQANPQGVLALLGDFKRAVDLTNDAKTRMRLMKSLVKELQGIPAYKALDLWCLEAIARLLADYRVDQGLAGLLGRFGAPKAFDSGSSTSPISPALAMLMEHVRVTQVAQQKDD